MTTEIKPFLSICIPAYNRCSELINALSEIEAQLVNGVEVIVSDNCSTDPDVRSTIQSFQQRLPLRCKRQPFNCGAEENVMRVAHYARGEYLLIHGSDDRLAPGALKTIVALLLAQQPDLLCFGYSIAQGHTRIDVHPRRERMLHHPNCQEVFDELPDLSCSLMFISSFVVRSGCWRAIDRKDDPVWLGSQYRHTCRLHALIKNGNIRSILTHPKSLVEAASADFDVHGADAEHSILPASSQRNNKHAFDCSLLFYDANLMLLLASSVYCGWKRFPSGLLASFRRSHSARQLHEAAIIHGRDYIRAYNNAISGVPLGLRYKFLLSAIYCLAALPHALLFTGAVITILADVKAFARLIIAKRTRSLLGKTESTAAQRM